MSLSVERPSFFNPDDPFARVEAAPPDRPMFGESGPSFADLLDIVNPLQHLPLIGTIYRALTGDGLSDGARLAGGALYGGPIGLIAAMANVGVEKAVGHEPGATALAAMLGDGAAEPAAEPQIVAAEPAKPAAAPAQLAAAAPAAPAATHAQLAALAPSAGATELAASPSSRSLPQLSPAAFDTLIRSVNGPAAPPRPEAAAALVRNPAWSRPGAVTRPVAMPPAVRAVMGPISPAALDALSQAPGLPAVAAPGARQAGLELHEALRAYAQQKGVAPGR